VQSPLIVDLFDLGAPDLLAGPNAWVKGRKPPGPNASRAIYRPFELEPGVLRLWEWVGPKSGILVYTPKGKIPAGKLTGADLFGNFTGGKSYSDGYAALYPLDLNQDGVVNGAELASVAVWLDANTDGYAQDGEIQPSTVYLKEISVEHDNFHNPVGAKRLDDSSVSTWDWWPFSLPIGSVVYPDPYVTPIIEGSKSFNSAIFTWLGLDDPRMGGIIRFFVFDKVLYVVAAGTHFPVTRGVAMAPVAIHMKDDVIYLRWYFDSPNYGLNTVAQYFPDSGELRAFSKPSNGEKYAWQGFASTPSTAPDDLAWRGLWQIGDASFVEVVLAAGTTPVVSLGPCTPPKSFANLFDLISEAEGSLQP